MNQKSFPFTVIKPFDTIEAQYFSPGLINFSLDVNILKDIHSAALDYTLVGY